MTWGLYPPLRRRGPGDQRQDVRGGNRDLAGNHFTAEGRVGTEDCVVERRRIRIEEDCEDEAVSCCAAAMTTIGSLDLEKGWFLCLSRTHTTSRGACFGEAP